MGDGSLAVTAPSLTVKGRGTREMMARGIRSLSFFPSCPIQFPLLTGTGSGTGTGSR